MLSIYYNISALTEAPANELFNNIDEMDFKCFSASKCHNHHIKCNREIESIIVNIADHFGYISAAAFSKSK